MSFDQSLITRGKNGNGIYAAAWLAGTSGAQALAKYYKSNDIESVNVQKTCDSLRLALRTNSQNCVVKENVIPFRICTNLLFGTLKIYQQQVNNLYKLSEDLVVRSSKYDKHEPAAAKRNATSSSNHKTIKKRRLTITHSNDYGTSNINYSEILEDLEKLAQETEEDETAQNDIPSPPPPIQTYNTHQPLTQLKIREIYIREINATYGVPELDDDCGFGDASNEDMVQFFTFSGLGEEHHASSARSTPARRKNACDEEPPEKQRRLSPEEDHTSFLKRTSSKRKIAYEEDIVEKQSQLCHDSSLDKLRSTDLMTTPCDFHESTHEGSYSPISPCESTIYREYKTLANNTNLIILSPTLTKDTVKQEYDSDLGMIPLTPNLTMDIKIALPNVMKQTVKDEYVDVNAVHNMKASALIIDQCIKLEEEQMLEQLHKPKKELRGITTQMFKTSKYKKRIPARELLKRFNKRTLLFRLTLKQKHHVDIIKCQQEYLNLLHEILKTDYKEEWASDVYPKWRKGSKTPQKHMKHKTSNKDMGQTINCNFLNENYNIIVNNDANDTYWDRVNPASDCLNSQISKKKCDNSEHFVSSIEWRPYGVMTKLLKIWRYSTESEINATKFCHSARVQIDKALAFSSLLSLSKSHFISITHHSETIEMDKIILGIATRDLIKSS